MTLFQNQIEQITEQTLYSLLRRCVKVSKRAVTSTSLLALKLTWYPPKSSEGSLTMIYIYKCCWYSEEHYLYDIYMINVTELRMS